MTSSASNVRSEPPSVRRIRMLNAPPGSRSMRSSAAFSTRDATAQDVVLERLDVSGPDPDERLRVDRQTRRRGRREDQLARPRQEAVGQLEARILLPDDEHPLVRIGLGGADIGIVVGVLEAVPGRDERLGDAHGDDKSPAGVDAVRRLDGEPRPSGLVDPGRRPSAVVADLERRPFGESGEVGLHLGPRREIGRAVHEARLECLRLGLLAKKAVPVVSLVRPASRVPPARAAWSTTGGAGRTASDGTSRPARDRPRRQRARHRAGGASRRTAARPARCRRRRPGTRRAGTARFSSAIGSRPAAGVPGPGASGTSPAGGRSGTARPADQPARGSAGAGPRPRRRSASRRG